MELRNKTILLVSPNHWGRIKVSKHHYATELARNNLVFFLNPPDIRHRGGIKVEEIAGQGSLRVVSYRPIFRAKKYLPTVIYQFLIRLQIRMIQRRLGVPLDLLWSFSATHFTDLRWFDAKIRIYHPVDELTDNQQVNIANTSDIVFTCTDYIRQQLEACRAPVHLIPHGLSEPFAEQARIRLNVPGGKMGFARKPNVGYAGNLFSEVIHRPLFRELVSQNPEVRFHVWGPTTPEASNVSAWVSDESIDFVRFLQGARNVVLHGVVTQEELAVGFQEMDVFLVVYRSDAPNFAISDSHKILGYLSTGRVVIATRLIDGAKYRGLVEMGVETTNSDYGALFQQVIGNLERYNDPETCAKRIAFSLRNTYRAHVDRIGTAIAEDCGC